MKAEGAAPVLRDSRFWFLLWMGVSGAVLLAAAAVMFPRSTWGDENHIVSVVASFAGRNWIAAWRDYPEITTPLAYSIYAAWGKLVGFGLIPLRALSLLIGFASMALLFGLCARVLRDPRSAFLVCLALLANPYLIGASIVVFTDILAYFLILLAFAALFHRRALVSAAVLCSALLCRQYAIVFWIAGAGTLAWQAREPSARAWALRGLGAYLAALVPLALLFRLWHGIAPPAGLAAWSYASGHEATWKPRLFLSYTAFSFLYLLPVLCVFRRQIQGRLILLVPAFLAGLTFFIFKMGQPDGMERYGPITSGLAHRAVETLAGTGAAGNMVLYVLVSLGFWMLLVLILDDVSKGRRAFALPLLPLSIAWYAFFLIMPFSHQVWEKYMMPLLPLMALRIAFLRGNKNEGVPLPGEGRHA